jgi:hypothetical protein
MIRSDARTATTTRETVALRNELQTTLPASVVAAVNWRAVQDAAAPALARGWTGLELARWALADLAGTPAENPGAVVVTTLRALAQVDPPREVTPAPPPITDVLAAAHARNQPTRDPAAWAARIRQGIHP